MRMQVLQRMALGKQGKALLVLAIALAGGGAAGCSKQDHSDVQVPVECKEGAETIEAALARAPARVEVGGTALSECLARGGSSSDLQRVGAGYLEAATHLAERAKQRPEGPEALRLGYLVGATRRGASGTQGIHEEMLRRIEQELIGVDTRSSAYRRGFEAGRNRG
jgi:hypothetical protein